MNVIEAAKAAGFGPHTISATTKYLERFAQIIRNQALEDAAVLFPQPHVEYFGREIQDAIRAMKKEQPNG